MWRLPGWLAAAEYTDDLSRAYTMQEPRNTPGPGPGAPPELGPDAFGETGSGLGWWFLTGSVSCRPLPCQTRPVSAHGASVAAAPAAPLQVFSVFRGWI